MSNYLSPGFATRINALAFVLVLVTACTSARKDDTSRATQQASEFELLEKSAYSGDYQAQRNLAYTLTTGIPNNPILGCAWRIVIVHSGSESVDQSDTGNKKLDCDSKLSPDELSAAEAQAANIRKKIQVRQ